jgi:hypothetical protein
MGFDRFFGWFRARRQANGPTHAKRATVPRAGLPLAEAARDVTEDRCNGGRHASG